MELYSIEVTEDIATKIRQMAEFGVFSAKNGSAELHFDANGNLSQVVMHAFHRVIHTPSVQPSILKVQ